MVQFTFSGSLLRRTSLYTLFYYDKCGKYMLSKNTAYTHVYSTIGWRCFSPLLRHSVSKSIDSQVYCHCYWTKTTDMPWIWPNL